MSVLTEDTAEAVAPVHMGGGQVGQQNVPQARLEVQADVRQH